MRHPSRQAGMAALEFLLIALPLLLTALAVLEIGRWQLTRVALSHALLEAGRSGQNGWHDPQAVATRFQAAVLPLWGADGTAERHERAKQQLHQTEQWFQQHHGRPLWQLQPAGHLYPGAAPASLVIELLWWHRPWVPGMQALLRQLGRLGPATDLQQGMASSGWLPIRLRLALEWQLLPDQPAPTPSALMQRGPVLPPAPAGLPTWAPGTPFWQGASAGPGSLFVAPGPGTTPPPPVTEPNLCESVLCCNNPAQVSATWQNPGFGPLA